MKYFFHAENAGRGLIGGVQFAIYDRVAGSAFGIYATDDPALISTLTGLSNSPTSAVTKITEVEYENCLKKKPLNSIFSPVLSTPSLSSNLPLKGQTAGVVVNEAAPQTAESEAPIQVEGQLEKSEDALQIGEVRLKDAIPPKPVPEPKQRGRPPKDKAAEDKQQRSDERADDLAEQQAEDRAEDIAAFKARDDKKK